MASKGLQSLTRSLRALQVSSSNCKDPLTQCLAPRLSRSMATETSIPADAFGIHEIQKRFEDAVAKERKVGQPELTQGLMTEGFYAPQATSVPTTIYKFPTMEPTRFETYSSKHLYLPLRRDILHRAVVFEGDMTRQGTASSKTRYEVHGSHRKIRPQKGTGKARLGTKQSPMLRGGGKSFGPHPRDFATGLPRKMYDLAWRTALSLRYRRGELIICENGMDIEHEYARYAKQIFKYNHWGPADGRSLIITGDHRDNMFKAMSELKGHGKVMTVDDVDVKDLLELGRVIIEKQALDEILREHQSDLVSNIRVMTPVS